MKSGTIVAWIACFAAGVACQHALSLSVAQWLWLIAAGAAAALLTVWRGRVPTVVLALLVAAWGGWWTASAELRLEDGLDPFVGAGPVSLRGVVVSHPEVDGGRVHVLVRLSRVARSAEETTTGALLRLTVVDPPPMAYGDVIELRAELRRPAEASNPGAFDYRAYLHRQGVTVTAFVEHSRHLTVSGRRRANPLMHLGGALRELVRAGLEAALPEEAAAVAYAVVLGDRRALSADVEERFRRAGMSHLLAVSGLHVGFLAAFAAALSGMLRLPQPWRVVPALSLAWVYVFATGARPSAVRAGVMTTAALVASAAGRRRDAATAVAVAAFVLLLHNPLLLSDASFQLSFAATAAIVWWHEPIARRLRRLPRPVASAAALTAAAQIGVTPLLAYTFHRFSVAGLAGSPLGAPLASLLVPAGLLAGVSHYVSPELGEAAGRAAALLARGLVTLARGFGSAPWSAVDVAPPSPAAIVAWWLTWWAALADRASSRTRRRVAFLAGFLVVVSLWMPLVSTVGSRELTLVFLDVGQGDAVLIRTPEGVTALVDGGGHAFAPAHDAANPGQTVVLPYLRYSGVGVVDVVVNTHGHEDHLQGLLPVLAYRPVPLAVDGGLSAPGPSWAEYERLVGETGALRWTARAGDVIRLGRSVRLEVLHPGEPMTGTRSDLNNNSVVLRLVYEDTAALLTGDVEAEAQLALLDRGADLRADVIKVPHHGSRRALVTAFYESVGAGTAVITVGPNKYGHPSPEVVAALETMGMRVYRTDVHGAVVLTSDGTRWAVRTVRRRKRRGRSGPKRWPFARRARPAFLQDQACPARKMEGGRR